MTKRPKSVAALTKSVVRQSHFSISWDSKKMMSENNNIMIKALIVSIVIFFLGIFLV